MKEVLEFIFADFWHFIGTLCFMVLFALWKPVEINVLNGFVKREDKDEG